jgi:hypothetical protein
VMASPVRVPPTLKHLDALSRIRPLSEAEVLQLERAIRRTTEKRENWHWTAGDVRRLREYLVRGKKPAMIAILMGRTERAIWRRMNRLGLGVRECAKGKCSIARRAAK